MPIETVQIPPFSVRTWTDGKGPTLLFLHGFEQHPGGAPFLQRLAHGRTVLAPEAPGYGESTGAESVDDPIDLVLLYRQLVEARGVGQVDVIGHCLGGMIAAEFAALCPHLVRRLVLVDSYGLWLDELELPDPFALTPDEFARAKWHDPASAPDPEPSLFEPDPADPLAAILYRSANLAAATKFLWPIPDHGLARRLPLIKAPTLILHGESDGLVPLGYADAFAAAIPGAELNVVAKAGHFPMIEAEDEFVSTVAKFLGAS